MFFSFGLKNCASQRPQTIATSEAAQTFTPLPEFLKDFGTEQQCEAALAKARWLSGWHCAHCGRSRFFHTRNGKGRLLWECFLCGYQSSSIAGSILENTKLPLTVWFLAMYLLTQNKNGTSALELKRMLGGELPHSLESQAQGACGNGRA